jgi:hypothetical protein
VRDSTKMAAPAVSSDLVAHWLDQAGRRVRTTENRG